eukprot:4661647-Lingulodinium_polyedra.AAC.1
MPIPLARAPGCPGRAPAEDQAHRAGPHQQDRDHECDAEDHRPVVAAQHADADRGADRAALIVRELRGRPLRLDQGSGR